MQTIYTGISLIKVYCRLLFELITAMKRCTVRHIIHIHI